MAVSPQRSGGTADRLAWAAVHVGALGVLLIATSLTPDPTGMGTHAQLGLPPCAVLASTGLPCPACGLTTSFAHIAHLQPGAAFGANAASLPLFAALVATALLSLIALWRGWPVDHTLRRFRVERIAVGLGLVLGIAWLLRVAAILLA